MTAEFINLISSSPEVSPRPKFHAPKSPAHPPSKALTFETASQGHSISSVENGRGQSAKSMVSTVAVTSTSKSIGPSSITSSQSFVKPAWNFSGLEGEKSKDNSTTKTKNDVFFLEDDFDTTIDSSFLTKAPSKSSIECQKAVSTTTAKSIGKFKPSNEVYYLEDDFDSTIDLDGSMLKGKSPPKTAVSSSKPITSALSKPPQIPKKQNNYFVLSDDSDIDTLPQLKPHPGVEAPKSSMTSSKPAFLTTSSVPQNLPVKGSNEFFFLDHSDIEADPDDPFTSEYLPLNKKRRLSSSPPSKPVAKASGFNRSHSNIEYSTTTKRGSGPRSKPVKDRTFDPIEFTSSPDPIAEAARKRKEKRKQPIDSSDEDDIFGLEPIHEERSGSSSGHKSRKAAMGASSDSELPELHAIAANSKKKSKVIDSKSVMEKYNASKAKERATKEKAVKAKEKAATKDAEKEQKRIDKENKAKEKARATELAKVNTLRTDKKISTPEMIVDLPSCLPPKLREQIEKFLSPLEVEYTEWESDIPIVRWRRKVTAEWNPDLDIWEPISRKIKSERHVLCILTAKAFVDMAIGAEGADLDTHVLKLKSKFDSCEIIYLVEGMVVWQRKNKNLKNRQFTEAVRSHLTQGDAPSASQRAKKKKEAEYVDDDIIEDALLRLQVMHGALIHHTAALMETAEWVLTFTQHISTIPYKTQKQALDTTFCMESGQVKTGDGASDTYVKMLQEIMRITAPIAYGIAAEYPTVQRLASGLEENGPLALEDCMKCANKDGAFTDRRIGPAISKRVYTTFTSRDPTTMDI